MIKWIVQAAIAPVTEIAVLFFKAQTDKERLRAKSRQIAMDADARVRAVKYGYWMGRIPLFVLEITHVTYCAMIMIDSMWPSDYVNPLKIPDWYEPYFGAVMAGVVGLSTWMYRRK